MNMSRLFLSVCIFLVSLGTCAQDTLKSANVEAILYTGKGKHLPLVVGLGGSEGGNAWASDYWKDTRNKIQEKGYAFLAVGYFGCKNTPKQLDRIALEDVHNAILAATQNKKVHRHKIAIIGGSRGADLAMLLASYYNDIDCVVGLVGSHAVFPGHTENLSTSSWTYGGQELPFVPVNDASVPFLVNRDLRGAFEAMLRDTAAEQKALIHVENINGPLLLLSATKDEICPSTPMGDKIMERLKRFHFRYHHEHVPIEGTHAEPLKHFDRVFAFLEKYFPAGRK